jgi:hypothetical protein
MNALVEHPKNSIQFGYRCFDRLLLNGLIQPFQQPERVLGFFNTYHEGKPVTRKTLTEIADQFQYWAKNRSEKWGAPILEPPDGPGDDSRRDKFLNPSLRSSPIGNGSTPVVSTVCSSRKWSIATTSSSIVGPRWTNSPNGYWI